MFGYVREYPPELKLKHHVLYRAVYCGLCKSMGRCTGFCSRVTLSYDGVFLALVRMALEKTKPEIQPERCFLHPFKRHPMLRQNAVLAYSARVSALLVYGKVADDVADTRGAKRMLYRMAQPFAAHFQKKAGLEGLRALVQQQLTQLSAYEAEPSDSFDKPADLFGAVCAECFSFGLEGEQKLLSRTVGSHVGRWIYAADALDDFENHLEEIRLSTLLTGPYDENNAIVSLNAGAGGTESCDWCSMLFRMYSRWADKKGFTMDVMNLVDGDEAGIKSVDFQINGTNAYGFLRSEHGVHRLVRISPFNAQGKRQTSFVSCEVMPELAQDNDIDIKPDDIRIDTYRSSGAGGQHINKTSSAIRITHFPTGIVVTCQNERSQFQNKDKAFEMLRAKLFLLKQQEEEAMRDGIRGDVKDIAWGSQIRSYVLQPYTMVKDTRTQEETSDTDGVLNGNIDRFINAYLKMQANKGLTQETQ